MAHYNRYGNSSDRSKCGTCVTNSWSNDAVGITSCSSLSGTERFHFIRKFQMTHIDTLECYCPKSNYPSPCNKDFVNDIGHCPSCIALKRYPGDGNFCGECLSGFAGPLNYLKSNKACSWGQYGNSIIRCLVCFMRGGYHKIYILFGQCREGGVFILFGQSD